MTIFCQKKTNPSFFTTKKEGKKTIAYALPTSHGRQAALSVFGAKTHVK